MGFVSAHRRTPVRRGECGQQASRGAAARTKEGRPQAALRSTLRVSGYGQLEVRVTVFEVIWMPGAVGVLSESAEMPVAVAE